MAQLQVEIDKNKAIPLKEDVNTSLSLQEIVAFLQSDKATNLVPFRPKGGEVYLFKPTKPQCKSDWRADGYR
jgi:hypothetical protein